MKKIALLASVTLVAASALTACGDDEAPPAAATTPGPEPTSSVTPPAEDSGVTVGPDAAPPPKRTMGQVSALATRPDNLVVDPELEGAYSDIQSPTGFEPYTVFVSGATSSVRFEATTPVGPTMPVLHMHASSADANVVFTAVGGNGPFDASVWIAVKGGKQIGGTYFASTLDGSTLDLTRDDQSAQKHGDLEYMHYTAHGTDPLNGSVYLIVEVPNGADVSIVAPELVGGAAPSPRITRTRPLEANKRAQLAKLSAKIPKPPMVRGRPMPKLPVHWTPMH